MLRSAGIYAAAVLFPVLVSAASASSVRYTESQEQPPPIPAAAEIDVSSAPPLPSVYDLPGITGDLPAQGEVILSLGNGVSITLIESAESELYVAEGDWGCASVECWNATLVSQLSPSGRYFAVGADGTDVIRGSVFVIDLETGQTFRTTPGGVWGCSDWLKGDILLIESAGELQPDTWINRFFGTQADGFTSDIVLFHHGSSSVILPENELYGYSLSGMQGVCDEGPFFDVEAFRNIVPSEYGLESTGDLYEWLDSIGYDAAFSSSSFRVFLDDSSLNISAIQPMILYNPH